jgi:hypothetical protein
MASEVEFSEIPRHELVAAALELGIERPDRFSDAELATQIRLQSSGGAPPRQTLPPSWLSVARNLVASVIEQGLNLPEAARVLRATVATTPRQKAPLPTVTLAQIYLAQKHTELAQTTLENVLRRDPDNYKARQLLLRLQAAQDSSLAKAAKGTAASESNAASDDARVSVPPSEVSPPLSSHPVTVPPAVQAELPGIQLAQLLTNVEPLEVKQALKDAAAELGASAQVRVTPQDSAVVPEVGAPSLGAPVATAEGAAFTQEDAAGLKPSLVVEPLPRIFLEVQRERGANGCVLHWDVTALPRSGSGLSRWRLGIRMATFVPTPRGALQLERWIPLTDASGALHVAVASVNVVRACVAERAPGGDLRVLCVAPH